MDTEHTPNFGMISGNNGVKVNMSTGDMEQNQGDGTNGIYEAQDDLGKTYYFRGAVQNNYVKFGGVDWRIVRINGDGTIRIALNQSIGQSVYNENDDDNAYVGYMYGTPGSNTYEATHANTNNSIIKTYLDTWYVANLQQYEDKIADAIYCNDRTTADVTYNDFEKGEQLSFNGTGKSTEETAYTGLKRTYIDHTPSLMCTSNNDKFTKESTLGNGALRHPIGLLTLDEYIMAGAGAYDITTADAYAYLDSTGAFYLYDNSNWYWSITPVLYTNNARVGKLYTFGYVYDESSTMTGGAVRPVVSLKSSSITGGTGTSSDSFVVGGTNDNPICLNGEGC